MNKNSTMERRFSHIPSPIAESTCINGSKMTTSAWGGSPLVGKNRSSSSASLNSSATKNSSRFSMMQRNKTNLSKIDPRIYTDVHSSGLTSRIVKYHNNSLAGMNRSASVSNLYTKAGQFPVVNLKRRELPYKASKQQLPMTRIAPPERSIYYGNTLSGLLRSSSVISLPTKSDEQLSHENRPIMHPPPTENDLAPTRSVLEVLKEISRKRINSEDLDHAEAATKKYCNYDNSHNNNDEADCNNAQDLLSAARTQKRQREASTAAVGGSELQQRQLTTATNNSLSSVAQQLSPEQNAKKRLCSYNNDITSSLSSSNIHNNNKRKISQQRKNLCNEDDKNADAFNRSQSSPEEYEMQKRKMQRQQRDLHFELRDATKSCVTPITPLPVTPLNHNAPLSRAASTFLPSADVQHKEAAPALRTVSAPVYNTHADLQKPQLTLFNKNCDDAADTLENNNETENDLSPEEAECARISFVKPKKQSSIWGGTKNPLIERTKKSKLAMMLCSLRGELYQGDDPVQDETDAVKTTAIVAIPAVAVSTATTTSVTSTPLSVTSTQTATSITTAAATSTIAIAAPSTVSATQLLMPTKPATGIVGINSLIAKDAANATATTLAVATTTAVAAATTAAAAVIAATKDSISTPQTVVGGFKFTPPKATTMLEANKPSISALPPTQFSFGIAASPSTSAVPTSTTTALQAAPIKAGGFSFGAPSSSTTTATTTAAATSAAVPTFTAAPATKNKSNNFSFGVATNSSVNSIAVSNTVPTTTATNTFSFGGNNALQAATTNATTAFSFGGNNATAAAPTAFGFASTTPATTASAFGTAAAPTIGSAATKQATTFEASKALTFGSSVAAATTSAPAATAATTSNSNQVVGGFAFGAAAQQKSTAVDAAKTFSFGAAANASSSNNSSNGAMFGFGSTATSATPAAATATTTNTPQAASTFSFGGNANAASSSSNVFGGATSTPSFGSVAQNSSNDKSANATAKSTFSFGASAAAPSAAPNFSTGNANATPFAFGGAAGGGAQTTTAAAATTAVGGGFSFGGVAANAVKTADTKASTNNLFAAASTTGIVKPSFSFGGGGGGDGNHLEAKSLFGGATTITASNNNQTTFAALSSGSAEMNQNKTFAFGNPTASTAGTAASSANIFGGAKATNVADNKSAPTAAAFSFGNAAATPSKPATARVTPTVAFSFGGGGGGGTTTNASNNNPVAASNNTAFSFGAASGTSSADAGSTAIKPFSFGSNAATSAPSSNIFGGTNAAAIAAAPAPSFNFGATAAGNVSAPTAATNMFNAAPGDRPIRRATRRLHKP